MARKAHDMMMDAIDSSTRTNSIVHVGYDDSHGLVDELLGNSDTEGNVENGDTHEFWGTTDGREWRVHVLTADVD